MKHLFVLSFLFVSTYLFAQGDKYAGTYVCKNGKVHFFSAAAVENIEATSQNALCVVNTRSKKVAVRILQTSFSFHAKLMQEHFNENYMESDKYPAATLDMVILEDIDFTKDGVYDVTLKGSLEMHGVKNDREIKGEIVIKNGQLASATSTFDVKLSDYKIKIPSVLGQNIAESLKVDIVFSFEKYQK